MLGCVAAVSATESPSHESPALIQRRWTVGLSLKGHLFCFFEDVPQVGHVPANFQEIPNSEGSICSSARAPIHAPIAIDSAAIARRLERPIAAARTPADRSGSEIVVERT